MEKFKTLNRKEVKAAKEVMETLCLSTSATSINSEMTAGYLTFHTVNECEYAWYFDGCFEVCIDIDSFEEADPEELGLY